MDFPLSNNSYIYKVNKGNMICTDFSDNTLRLRAPAKMPMLLFTLHFVLSFHFDPFKFRKIIWALLYKGSLYRYVRMPFQIGRVLKIALVTVKGDTRCRLEGWGVVTF